MLKKIKILGSSKTKHTAVCGLAKKFDHERSEVPSPKIDRRKKRIFLIYRHNFGNLETEMRCILLQIECTAVLSVISQCSLSNFESQLSFFRSFREET